MKRSVFALILILLLFSSPALAMTDHFDGMAYCTPGVYIAGLDMAPGEFMVLVDEAAEGSYAIGSGYNGFDVEPVSIQDTFAGNRIITVEDGEYVEFTDCIAVELDDFYTRYVISLNQSQDYMLKVGKDVQPGTYRLRKTDEYSGCYAVYASSRIESPLDALQTETFFEDTAYVTLQNGQYIILKRCTFDQ